MPSSSRPRAAASGLSLSPASSMGSRSRSVSSGSPPSASSTVSACGSLILVAVHRLHTRGLRGHVRRLVHLHLHPLARGQEVDGVVDHAVVAGFEVRAGARLTPPA